MTNDESIDLGPAARQVAVLASAVEDHQLGDPTPCAAMDVAALLEHLMGLSLAFRLAAEKRSADTRAPGGSSAALPTDWRDRLPRHLEALTAAWHDPAAWEGDATAGGVTMPAAEMGVVALDELVLHGWDLARATGRPFRCQPDHVEAVLGFTRAVAAAGPRAREGLFGPPVEVPGQAPPFDHALALAGRDPNWVSPIGTP